MKKYFLVKGEERIEIIMTNSPHLYLIKSSTNCIYANTACDLGYTLEEVEERREWWLSWDGCDRYLSAFESFKQANEGRARKPIHVVELREGERVLSLEEFAKIWDRAVIQETYAVNRSDKSVVFPKLCRELGFKEGDS